MAAPILLLWLMSPAVAWWLSRPLPGNVVQLAKEDREFLEELSRKTWRFFETFVSQEDNWLPPDNFQDYPAAVIAHRTSPTNIGLALLSNLTAYDFGFISATELVVRTDNTFATMKRLERHQGHFFNWYDTRTLEPLLPRLHLDRRQWESCRSFAYSSGGLSAAGRSARLSAQSLRRVT